MSATIEVNPFSLKDLAGWRICKVYLSVYFSPGHGNQHGPCSLDCYFVNDVLNYPWGSGGRYSQEEVRVLTNGTVAYYLDGKKVDGFLSPRKVEDMKTKMIMAK